MSKQECKVFVGGLSWETTDAKLRSYFDNFGTTLEAFVSYDRHTGRPRGFGFVVFEDAAVADKVVSLQHTIDRREVEAKKAVPKEEHPVSRQPNGEASQRTKKIFVGGLAPSVDEQVFRQYFQKFGPVEDAVVMYDHDNKRPRGFGFVTFHTEEAVDAVFGVGTMHSLHDKDIEIKRAVPRDQMPATRNCRGVLVPGRGGFPAARGYGGGPGFQPAFAGGYPGEQELMLAGLDSYAAAGRMPALGNVHSAVASLGQALQQQASLQNLQHASLPSLSLGGLPGLQHGGDGAADGLGTAHGNGGLGLRMGGAMGGFGMGGLQHQSLPGAAATSGLEEPQAYGHFSHSNGGQPLPYSAAPQPGGAAALFGETGLLGGGVGSVGHRAGGSAVPPDISAAFGDGSRFSDAMPSVQQWQS